MPYLRDSSQEVARAYGARATPDVFVLDGDGRLRYRGRRIPTTTILTSGRPGCGRRWTRCWRSRPERAENRPIGCSIKWKR